MLIASVIIESFCGIVNAFVTFQYFQLYRLTKDRSFLFFIIMYLIVSVLWFTLVALQLTGVI